MKKQVKRSARYSRAFLALWLPWPVLLSTAMLSGWQGGTDLGIAFGLYVGAAAFLYAMTGSFFRLDPADHVAQSMSHAASHLHLPIEHRSVVHDEGATGMTNDHIFTLRWAGVVLALEVREGIFLVNGQDGMMLLRRERIGEDAWPLWRHTVAAHLERAGRVPLERGPDAPAA
ncbi:MAG: hypothetical protein KDA21_07890 [Phycisphaerales bacterium]|nr:hypothetical protein [Phycisphaerales bacterium]